MDRTVVENALQILVRGALRVTSDLAEHLGLPEKGDLLEYLPQTTLEQAQFIAITAQMVASGVLLAHELDVTLDEPYILGEDKPTSQTYRDTSTRLALVMLLAQQRIAELTGGAKA